MVFGYTPLDPLVVLFGTFLAIWYLNRNAVQLIGFMPTALSLWFFAPFVTNLTLWQTIPMLLTARVFVKGRFRLPPVIHPVVMVLVMCFALSAGYALIAGADGTRTLIRIIYYLGILATLTFAYEMGQRPEAYEILLKGLVVMGVVYAAYGAYQVVAFYAGLPLRGIVYSASGSGTMAFEGGVLRINSLANEPKRLGYVLFLAAMACVFLAQFRSARRARQLRWTSVGILLISLMTFAGSYFFTIALFGISSFLLYPSRTTALVFGAVAITMGIVILAPDLWIFETIQDSYLRRLDEVEMGLDGAVVYRQEFFAWDYLEKNPLSYITGVGLGQYYSVLNATYGEGAGYNEMGGLMPLNSNLLELTFDLGGLSAFLIYGCLLLLIVRLRLAGETFFCTSLLFLLIQSLTIINLLYIVFFAGVAMGRLALKRKEAFADSQLNGAF